MGVEQPEGLHRHPPRKERLPTGAKLPPPMLPVDFGYWKVAPAALGLLSLGVYAGFRKQVD